MPIDPTSGPPVPASRRQRKKPRKVSPASLERAALHYLERYSASAEGVRRVLSRRIARAVEAHDQDPRELADWANAVIDKLVGNGLLDDRRFAEGRARSLAGRGYGRRRIALALAQKGVDRGTVEAAIESLDDEGMDERATAIAFARRRRLGPFRTNGDRWEHRQRDMAAMARAGFGFGLAREIIEAEETDLD